MIINKLKFSRGGGKSLVSSIILDEKSNESNETFFSVENEYAEYLVTENADAFVLAAILPALVTGQNIIVDAPISDYFYIHSKKLIYLFGKVFGYPPIEIKAKSVEHFNFNPTAVATGFSGGVDSFATYINYTKDDCPPDFKITHLTLFNVGAYGRNYDYITEQFGKDIKRAKEFAQYVNKPLVLVDSNVSDLYVYEGINTFALRSIISIAMPVLLLQKLFKKYYISSTYTIDLSYYDKKDQSHNESVLTQLLSNNNVEIFISEPDLNRVEKTKMISVNTITKSRLHVCASSVYNCNSNTNYQKDGYLNCSECLKCTRTLLTLDFLGELENYSEIFNLEKYYRMRDDLIVDTYLWRDINPFKREIYDLMCSKGYKLPENLEQRIKEKFSDIEFIKLQSKYPKL